MSRVFSLYGFYMLVLLLAAILASTRFRKSEPANRVMTLMMWVIFVGEICAQYARIKYKYNLSVYAISDILQFILTIAYFHYSIGIFRRRPVGIILGIIGVGASIANMVINKSVGDDVSTFMFFHGIVTICLVLFAFARLMIEEEKPDLTHNPHFWIGIVLLFYWCISFFNWTLFDYFKFLNQKALSSQLIRIVLILCAVSYGALGVIIRLLPRKRATL